MLRRPPCLSRWMRTLSVATSTAAHSHCGNSSSVPAFATTRLALPTSIYALHPHHRAAVFMHVRLSRCESGSSPNGSQVRFLMPDLRSLFSSPFERQQPLGICLGKLLRGIDSPSTV